MARGKFIALEGIDGAGTTTQCRLLGEALTRRGIRAYLTAEPSQGPVGRLLREALQKKHGIEDLTLVPLFAADRLDHLSREIIPRLTDGVVVITDRYTLSSLAYQSMAAPFDYVKAVNEHARHADLNVFVRVSPEIADRRRRERGGAGERFDDNHAQIEIAQRYERLLGCAGNHVVVNGDRPVDVVHTAITEHIDKLLEA
ncbi:MAG: dTMP kinase [Clostridia bacterium]|nr:dTMP kinase [Deltaproteobacteria bacterium]